MTAKKLFVHELVVEAMPKILWLRANLPGLYNTYYDNGWNPAGSDPIIAQDIEDQYSFSPETLDSFISQIRQLAGMAGAPDAVFVVPEGGKGEIVDEAAVKAEYSVNLNKLRFGKVG